MIDGIVTSGSIFSNGPLYLLISGGLFALLGYGKMEHYHMYIRSLQFLLIMPGIPIVLQSNIIIYFTMIKGIADYDILSYFNIWNLPGFN